MATCIVVVCIAIAPSMCLCLTGAVRKDMSALLRMACIACNHTDKAAVSAPSPGIACAAEATSMPRFVQSGCTARRCADVKYQHKKQSGGSGQFAEVRIKFVPGEPGSGFTFRSDIKGGVVPKEYIPGVTKGLEESMASGIIAGYPVVDLEALLYDGASPLLLCCSGEEGVAVRPRECDSLAWLGCCNRAGGPMFLRASAPGCAHACNWSTSSEWLIHGLPQSDGECPTWTSAHWQAPADGCIPVPLPGACLPF